MARKLKPPTRMQTAVLLMGGASRLLKRIQRWFMGDPPNRETFPVLLRDHDNTVQNLWTLATTELYPTGRPYKLVSVKLCKQNGPLTVQHELIYMKVYDRSPFHLLSLIRKVCTISDPNRTLEYPNRTAPIIPAHGDKPEQCLEHRGAPVLPDAIVLIKMRLTRDPKDQYQWPGAIYSAFPSY